MKHTYVGPIEHLKGKTALVRNATHGKVVAQFDDVTLRKSGEPMPVIPSMRSYSPTMPALPDDALGYGWHAFDPSDFTVTL